MTWNKQQKTGYARLLHAALAADDSVVPKLNQAVMEKVRQQTAPPEPAAEESPARQNLLLRLLGHGRRLVPVPLLAAALILVFSLTAYAAIRLRNAGEVSRSMGYEGLAEAFQGEDALSINETQTSQGYDICLLGITFGRIIQDMFPDLPVSSDYVYGIVALSNADGTPLPDPHVDPEGTGIPDLYLTFLAKGYDADDNPLDMRRRDFCYEDGVCYYLVQCANLTRYVEDTLYLAVNEGIFCSPMDFQLDPVSGAFTLNESYDNVHALFEIPLEDSLLETLAAAAADGSADPAGDRQEPVANPSAASGISSDWESSANQDSSAVSETALPEAVSAIEAAPSYPAWTDGQLQQLQSLSLSESILYAAEDRILTIRKAEDGSLSVLRTYDYEGCLLWEMEVSLIDAYHRNNNPICTPYGFAVPAGSGYQVYDYDCNLLYQFDLEEIPSDYPPTKTQVGTATAESSESFSYTGYYEPRGTFSSNLRYFMFQTSVMDHDCNVSEGWLYDSVSGQWNLVYHGDQQSDSFASLSFYSFTPSNDGSCALFLAGYVKDKDSRIPTVSSHCYGILSLETGEILLMEDGTVGTVREVANLFFLDLSSFYDQDGRIVIIDETDLSVTTLPLEKNDDTCNSEISPDGRWILTVEDQWQDHTYHCRIYDWRAGTATETFDLQLADQSRAYFRCYPGGYGMINFRDTLFQFYTYEENAGQ